MTTLPNTALVVVTARKALLTDRDRGYSLAVPCEHDRPARGAPPCAIGTNEEGARAEAWPPRASSPSGLSPMALSWAIATPQLRWPGAEVVRTVETDNRAAIDERLRTSKESVFVPQEHDVGPAVLIQVGQLCERNATHAELKHCAARGERQPAAVQRTPKAGVPTETGEATQDHVTEDVPDRRLILASLPPRRSSAEDHIAPPGTRPVAAAPTPLLAPPPSELGVAFSRPAERGHVLPVFPPAASSRKVPAPTPALLEAAIPL
jgi:hypothetical protein